MGGDIFTLLLRHQYMSKQIYSMMTTMIKVLMTRNACFYHHLGSDPSYILTIMSETLSASSILLDSLDSFPSIAHSELATSMAILLYVLES